MNHAETMLKAFDRFVNSLPNDKQVRLISETAATNADIRNGFIKVPHRAAQRFINQQRGSSYIPMDINNSRYHNSPKKNK